MDRDLNKLKENGDALKALLDAPVPGLLVWNAAVNAQWKKIAEAWGGPLPSALLACELGYRACEKGKNIQMALQELQEILQ